MLLYLKKKNFEYITKQSGRDNKLGGMCIILNKRTFMSKKYPHNSVKLVVRRPHFFDHPQYSTGIDRKSLAPIRFRDGEHKAQCQFPTTETAYR